MTESTKHLGGGDRAHLREISLSAGVMLKIITGIMSPGGPNGT